MEPLESFPIVNRPTFGQCRPMFDQIWAMANGLGLSWAICGLRRNKLHNPHAGTLMNQHRIYPNKKQNHASNQRWLLGPLRTIEGFGSNFVFVSRVSRVWRKLGRNRRKVVKHRPGLAESGRIADIQSAHVVVSTSLVSPPRGARRVVGTRRRFKVAGIALQSVSSTVVPSSHHERSHAPILLAAMAAAWQLVDGSASKGGRWLTPSRPICPPLAATSPPT